ncbi:hypothetical protein [Streptomyces sp. NPDC098781]|uniref:hypothetical protein n=1 Tax=Streptomyces sp. NPDC098781 TaxID=3366097 RepID=UPI00380896BE
MKHKKALSRRNLLTGASAAAFLTALAVPRTSIASSPTSSAAALPDLTPLPAGAPLRRAFLPEEQSFAPYLVSLAAMVNGIEDTDPATTGFFGNGWWRSPNSWYNARVQEHVYTLAWFATQSRSWNPYTKSPALLAALDAALGHYLRLQHSDGSWPEYSSNEHSLSATGFGLGYLSKTQALMRSANILPSRRSQISAALRQAMTWLLNPSNGAVWQTRLTFANQVTGGLAGACLALEQDPDAALWQQLTAALERLRTNGQSPAGFFYEEGGMDMNYNFEVMLPEMADAWRKSNNPHLVTMTEKYTEWLGYNMLREPDGSGWITNIAPSTRTSTLFYNDTRPDPERTALNSQFVPVVPDLGAFLSAREDLAAARAQWAAASAPVSGLVKQDTSPRILTHALYGERFATRSAKQRAIAALPYLASSRFTERRTDQGRDFLYVKRRDVYLGAYLGTRPTTHVRTGLSFLWHPVAGTVIQSLNNNNYACWATVLPGQAPDADGPVVGTVHGGEPYAFRFSSGSGVVTDVSVADRLVRRSVRAGVAATEQIPLVLHPNDQVAFTNGTRLTFGGSATATAHGLELHRGNAVIKIGWETARSATITAASTVFYMGGKRMHILRVPHAGQIDVTIRLSR